MSRMLAGDPVQARALLARAQDAGGTDPKILQNIALLDNVAPRTTAPAAPTPAPADRNGFPVATPPAPHGSAVARNALPAPAPAGAHAPTPLIPAPVAHGGANVVMQDVPVDPLAGPVAHHGKPAKPTRLAKDRKADDHAVAANVPAKPDKKVAANTPAKPAKPAKNAPPALRMAADAAKP